MEQILQLTKIHTDNIGISCPSCQSLKNSKNGKENGSQRYRCKNCGKNFRSTTGSSIYRIHKKSHIQKYIECIHQGLTLRNAAKQTGISLTTAFVWRHKFLSALSQNVTITTNSYTTTSVLKLPYSEKGSRNKSKTKKPKSTTNLLRTDATGRFEIRLQTPNRSSFTSNIAESDKPSAFVSSNSIPKIIKSRPQIIRVPYTHQIQQIQLKLEEWIVKFRGVATKYLNHYWAWLTQINDFEIFQKQERILLEKCLSQ